MSASRSKSSQSTNLNTTNTATNQQVGASEGAIAFGAESSGNTVTFQSADADVIKAASDAIVTGSGQALALVGESVDSSLGFAGNVVETAFNANRAVTSGTLSTAETLAQRSAESADALRQTLTDLAKSPEERGSTNLLIAAAVMGGLILYVSKK